MLTSWRNGKGWSGRWVCYKTHFRGAYLFCCFAKATCRLQAFHLCEVQGIYNRNVEKKTNFIFHQIWTWNLAKWRFMLLQNSGIDQCCVIFPFFFPLSVSTDYLCMYWVVIMFSISDAVCSLSCTLIKDVDFVSGRPGFKIPTPNISRFNVCVDKKTLKIKLQQSTNGYEFNRI